MTYPATVLLGFGFSAMLVNALSFAAELIGDNKVSSPITLWLQKYLHFFSFFVEYNSSNQLFSFCFIEHIWNRIWFYEFDVIPSWRNIDHHNTEFVSWRKVILHFVV